LIREFAARRRKKTGNNALNHRKNLKPLQDRLQNRNARLSRGRRHRLYSPSGLAVRYGHQWNNVAASLNSVNTVSKSKTWGVAKCRIGPCIWLLYCAVSLDLQWSTPSVFATVAWAANCGHWIRQSPRCENADRALGMSTCRKPQSDWT